MTDRPPAPVVVALGGNAISPPGEADSIARQFRQTGHTAVGLAALVETGVPVVITHGNGPQVGSALRRAELAAHEVYRIPLEICVADLQGGMGYMIAQCLTNELTRRGHDISVSTLVTTVLVDDDDPAFGAPDKPVGPFCPPERAAELRAEGWVLREYPDGRFRRVVASPRPRAIPELELIRHLCTGGHPLIAVGGGGIPVVRAPDGMFEGREAVVDKDRASACLATGLNASTLLIVTAIERVELGFGTDHAVPLDRLTVREARRHLDAGEFPPGSMGPKIQAALDYLEHATHPERRVVICDIDGMAEALAGHAGTHVVPG